MKTLGIIGLGAFGQLMVKHLAAHFYLVACYTSPHAHIFAEHHNIKLVTPATMGKMADIVVFATPIDYLQAAITNISPHLRPQTLVLDVTSVKVLPAKIMLEHLPPDIDIIATHPLFGPQSAADGIKGRKIAVCPLRGTRGECVADWLASNLDLDVIVTTPEDHDRNMAMVQGLTHMIVKVLVEMEPLPDKLTTVSFDLLMRVVGMLRYDSDELFLAIQRSNPYASEVRQRFFDTAEKLRKTLDGK